MSELNRLPTQAEFEHDLRGEICAAHLPLYLEICAQGGDQETLESLLDDEIDRLKVALGVSIKVSALVQACRMYVQEGIQDSVLPEDIIPDKHTVQVTPEYLETFQKTFVTNAQGKESDVAVEATEIVSRMVKKLLADCYAE